MDLSKIPNDTWDDLLSGRKSCDFEFLALQILMGRLRMRIMRNPQPHITYQSINEIKDFLKRMEYLPVVHKDLEKIYRIRNVS